MSNDILIRADHISKKFCRNLKRSMWYGMRDIAVELLALEGSKEKLREKEFWSLQDVSFDLYRGESLGLIGYNGAGKSTLLKLLSGIMKPDSGEIKIKGRVNSLIELGAGFNPVLSGRENIYINGAILGISKKQIDGIMDEIILFSGLNEFIDMPVQSYSSGMRVRLGFAIASHLEPDILLVDEVLAVGDGNFQRKCLQHISRYIRNGGSLILVSHSMHLIQSVCTKGIFLNRGRIEYSGDINQTITSYFNNQYLHDNTLSFTEIKNLDETHPIIIKKAWIRSLKNPQVLTGDPVEIEIEYESSKEYPDVILGLSLWTGDQGVRITTCSSRYDGKKRYINRGPGAFRCLIPEFPAAPGTYAVKIGIYDRESSWPIVRIGWDTQALIFAVASSGSELDNRRSTDGDLIGINAEWK